jgi:hypothetical protein
VVTLKGIDFEREWIKIKNGEVYIPRGYSWDGCSPKFKFLDILWGVPDGSSHENDFLPKTYYASMVHSAIYLYRKEIPLTRKQADMIYLDMMISRGFKLAKLYWWFTRVFGGITTKWKNK